MRLQQRGSLKSLAKIVASVIMTGAFTAITNLLDVNHVREAIKRNVPKAFAELNLTAFEKVMNTGKIF